MKVHEIRVGNFVHPRDCRFPENDPGFAIWGRVKSVKGDEVEFRNWSTTNSKIVDPIPLNQAWIDLFIFDPAKSKQNEFLFHEKAPVGYLKVVAPGESLGETLYYVHELQNEYYEITGEELPLKLFLDSVPKNLDQALHQLVNSIPPNAQITIMDREENDYVANSSFQFGNDLRNAWGLMKREGPLYKWFNRQGVKNPDDMYNILITSLHRTLNCIPIELDEQLRKIRNE